MSIHMNMFVTVHATAPCVSEPAGQFPVIFWPRHLVLSREQHDKQRVRVRVRAMPLMGASFFDLDIGGCWRSSYRYSNSTVQEQNSRIRDSLELRVFQRHLRCCRKDLAHDCTEPIELY